MSRIIWGIRRLEMAKLTFNLLRIRHRSEVEPYLGLANQLDTRLCKTAQRSNRERTQIMRRKPQAITRTALILNYSQQDEPKRSVNVREIASGSWATLRNDLSSDIKNSIKPGQCGAKFADLFQFICLRKCAIKVGRPIKEILTEGVVRGTSFSRQVNKTI